jgi:uncharacterized membrane protein YidH (DUF202 family)
VSKWYQNDNAMDLQNTARQNRGNRIALIIALALITILVIIMLVI